MVVLTVVDSVVVEIKRASGGVNGHTPVEYLNVMSSTPRNQLLLKFRKVLKFENMSSILTNEPLRVISDISLDVNSIRVSGLDWNLT